MAELQARAKVVQHLAAALGPDVEVRFRDKGTVECRTRGGNTMTLGHASDEAVWEARARALAEDRKPKTIFVRPRTLAEMRVEQKALELELAFERQRTRLAETKSMREAAMAKRRS